MQTQCAQSETHGCEIAKGFNTLPAHLIIVHRDTVVHQVADLRQGRVAGDLDLSEPPLRRADAFFQRLAPRLQLRRVLLRLQ